jgi:hypothetical protein
VRKDKKESTAKLKKLVAGILDRLDDGTETLTNLISQQRKKYGKAVRLVTVHQAQVEANEDTYKGVLMMAWADGTRVDGSEPLHLLTICSLLTR